MAAIQERTTLGPTSLRRRMALLARLRDLISRADPRRPLLEAIWRRMDLFARMTERLGVAPPKSAFTAAVLWEAEQGCLECVAWRRCGRWLDGKAPADDAQAFCPNHAIFAVLPHEPADKSPA